MKNYFKGFVVGMALTASAAIGSELEEEIVGYMDFAPYDAGIIMPGAFEKDVYDAVYLVDTRDAEQFEKATIPGAINIEWREIPSRLEELPTDKKVVLFCNTGSLSAQAAFAARVLGMENVVVLQEGYIGWRYKAPYKPN